MGRLAEFPILHPALVLVLAAALDAALGDPWSWPHPVQAMGWLIQRGGKLGWQWFQPPWMQRLWGIGLAIVVIGSSGLLTAAILAGATRWHPLLGFALEIVLLASCWAERSLRDAAQDVLEPLTQGNLAQARQQLAQYVGRETTQLTPTEIRRAILETVSENTTDGVLAPLFYAGLGSLMGIGAAPLAMAYKAASTLDSMVGYKRAPYTYVGWFSARLEDGLTWLPCRLTVLTVALLSGRPMHVWQLCWRDARADPSPNAGWSECAYAAALGVQLGGWNQYQGKPTFKPYLGDSHQSITAVHVRQALALTRRSFYLWLTAASLLTVGQGMLSVR
ncbi:MAG: adenosylcobinamide-phosphate synthase CbiB [Cyanobacteria bacterium J06632_22]